MKDEVMTLCYSAFILHPSSFILENIMGSRRKARECALQMLFAADVADAARGRGGADLLGGTGRH